MYFDDIPDSTEDEKFERYERYEKCPEYEEKQFDKMENGIPPTALGTSGPARASFKKSRNAKVAPEDAHKKTVPRKPPVPRFERSKGIPKPKPLPKGAYRNTTSYGPKVYGPEPIRFKNETVPFVPLVTSHPPPSTTQPPTTEEPKEEKIADVEKLLKDEGFTSGSNGRGKSTADEDQISIDHLTNPVFGTGDKLIMMDYDVHTGQKSNEPEDMFKGRINVPKAPEKSGQESEGERFMSEEAKKHLKSSMTAYLPTLGRERTPKV